MDNPNNVFIFILFQFKCSGQNLELEQFYVEIQGKQQSNERRSKLAILSGVCHTQVILHWNASNYRRIYHCISYSSYFHFK